MIRGGVEQRVERDARALRQVVEQRRQRGVVERVAEEAAQTLWFQLPREGRRQREHRVAAHGARAQRAVVRVEPLVERCQNRRPRTAELRAASRHRAPRSCVGQRCKSAAVAPRANIMLPATEKLYFDDAYALRFEARVLRREPLTAPSAGGAVEAIVLEKTLFYPTGGGQPHDLGRLGGAAVLDVAIEDGVVRHHVGPGFAVGEGALVAGEVEGERRADFRAQHHAQHLLSAATFRLYGKATTAVRLGESVSTVDLAGPLTAAQISSVEDEVARIAAEARPVRIHYVPPYELEAFGLRRPPQVDGVVRVIEVEDFDRAACGGTHPRTTAEVAPVRVLHVERVRGSEVRLHFVAGRRALLDYRAKAELLHALAAEHSTQPEKLAAVLAKQRRDAEELALRLRAAQRALHALWVPQWIEEARVQTAAGAALLVARVLEGASPDDLTALARELASRGARCLLCAQDEQRLHAVAASPRGGTAANLLLAPFLQELGGKGGGSAEMARGSAPRVAAVALERALARWRET
jgi:alanyl-tRNA synthetase